MTTRVDDMQQLDEVLAAERAALLEADYSRLGEFAEAKTRLVTRLVQSHPPEQVALDLQAKLTRNAALLKAASDGFRATIQHLSSPEALGTALYTADGSRKVMDAKVHRVERKA